MQPGHINNIIKGGEFIERYNIKINLNLKYFLEIKHEMAEEKKDIKDEAKKESKFKDGYTDENAEVWFHLGFGPVNEDEHDMNAHDRFITFRSRMYGKAALEA